MFQKLNNIETSFRQMRVFLIVLIIVCAGLAGYAAYASYSFIEKQRSQIYVLADGQSLILAKTNNIRDNRPVEAKDHIKRFHQLFFSLDPDEKVINDRMVQAMYYGDNSVQSQYQNLKESGYFTNIVGANISQDLIIDSVTLYEQKQPYYARFFGRLKIIRSSTITYRNLITEAYLREVTRTDNNPHGFLMEKWAILDNRDISVIDRATGQKMGDPLQKPSDSSK